MSSDNSPEGVRIKTKLNVIVEALSQTKKKVIYGNGSINKWMREFNFS